MKKKSKEHNSADKQNSSAVSHSYFADSGAHFCELFAHKCESTCCLLACFVCLLCLLLSIWCHRPIRILPSVPNPTLPVHTPTMCVHVNTLPDDCLLPIFDLIPLSALLYLDQVCPRWASLLPSACFRRRTLALILGGFRPDDSDCFEIPFNSNLKISFDDRYPHFDLPAFERESSFTMRFLMPQNISFNEFLSNDDESQGFFDILYQTSLGCHTEGFTEMSRFRNAHFSGQLVAYFIDLFPNICNLVVIHSRCFEGELNSVIDLVGSSWSLSTLKLWLATLRIDDRHADNLDRHPVHTLLRTINQQSTLQQLTLDIDGDGDDEFAFPVECYSFIAKLKVVKLLLGIYDGDNLICDNVQRFGGTELRYIGLGSYYDAPMKAVLNAKLEIITKVRHLYWNFNFETVEQFNQLCWRYTSLTILKMDWSPAITFTKLVTNLSSLAQLTYLKLFITFSDHPANPFALVQQVEGDEEELQRMSLPQVKILKLDILKSSHHDFESLSPLVFPSVVVIIWWDFFFSRGCTTCKRRLNGHYDRERANRCYRLTILSLKNKMTNPQLRLYARSDTGLYIDWSNYVRTEDDDLPEIVGGDQVEQPEEEA